ncbi:conserved hypothetical protein [Methylocella silvestris BL2]|uniref:DarT domain-containing protein n=1 Tax=Methylocella silvestris (strain DSM 15510 / CIP 108128 / LMG 27833 / NCIMB 13906 / BL2) TaxID=395965 RepID=B8EIX0_METSB|nr:DUF4433 domain-containing protein [Methylocella silvestris]ACK52462.1 conserved hypothetical protein [Methylocella silvestris BL2]
MPAPAQPKIYHIIHSDRLASIIADGFLWPDAAMAQRQGVGTTIGMSNIKARRLNELTLSCHPHLRVGHCTPFYFCSRSVMLYLIYRRNEELTYKGGKSRSSIWKLISTRRLLGRNRTIGAGRLLCRMPVRITLRTGRTLRSLAINWDAVQARQWSGNAVSRSVKEGKQAEFLIERAFPWRLVERIGVFSQGYVQPVSQAMQGAAHRPEIEIRRDWYY